MNLLQTNLKPVVFEFDGIKTTAFYDGTRSNENKGVIYIFFENPMCKFLPLFEEFADMMEDSLQKDIWFVRDINAVYIYVNKFQDFTKYGIQDFIEQEKEKLEGFSKLEVNGAFLFTIVMNALNSFYILYGRPIFKLF